MITENITKTTDKIYVNPHEKLHERARAFIAEHSFFYHKEERPFLYEGDFVETTDRQQEKFVEKRCWLKTSYLERGDGTPGMRITFNAFDGAGGPNISKTFWADSKEWAGLSEEERGALHAKRKENQRVAIEKAKKEKAITDELASKGCNRFYEAKEKPPTEATTYFSKRGLGQPYDAHTLHWEQEVDYSGEEPIERQIALVALRDGKGEIRALQELHPEKKLWPGQDKPRDKHYTNKTSGCFALFGALENGREILVAEGVATAITLFRATKKTTVAAMDSGNLPKVVKELRKRYPKSKIIICADNDHHREAEGKGNPGLDAARKTALEYECKVAMPTFPEGKEFNDNGNARTDFDDLRQLLGPEAVKEQIEAAAEPEPTINPPEPAVDNEENPPAWVQDFNKEYAVIRQGKTLIMREGVDPVFKRPTVFLEPVSSFHAWHKTTRGDDGKPLSTQWIAHRSRREYPDGLVFDPRKEGDFDGCYNLFRGFPIKPKRGDCSLFWELVAALCDSKSVKITYVRRWLAHMIQRPWEMPETAIGMRGLQGIGKGRFAAVIEALVAPHYMEIAQMGQITGRFTSHLKDLIFVYADEAVWGGNKAEVGALKSLITQEIQTVEQKNIDPYSVRNCKRFLFSSNEDWIVPLDPDDRRFFIIDCGDRLKENHQFFKKLRTQMEEGGGLSALMRELLNEDIKGWHPRDMPNSGDGFDLKLRGLATPLRWLYEALDKGSMTPQTPMYTPAFWLSANFEILKSVVYERYQGFCENIGARADNNALFWKKIREALAECPNSRPRKEEGRGRSVTLPGKEGARKAFESFSKSEGAIAWDE